MPDPEALDHEILLAIGRMIRTVDLYSKSPLHGDLVEIQEDEAAPIVEVGPLDGPARDVRGALGKPV
jgi:hypothetical protein